MKNYITRFIQVDYSPREDYFYHTPEEAKSHLDLFRDDDSGLYTRVEVIEYNTGKVLETFVFPPKLYAVQNNS